MTYNMSLPFQFQSFVYFIIWGAANLLVLRLFLLFSHLLYPNYTVVEELCMKANADTDKDGQTNVLLTDIGA